MTKLNGRKSGDQTIKFKYKQLTNFNFLDDCLNCNCNFNLFKFYIKYIYIFSFYKNLLITKRNLKLTKRK